MSAREERNKGEYSGLTPSRLASRLFGVKQEPVLRECLRGSGHPLTLELLLRVLSLGFHCGCKEPLQGFGFKKPIC